MGLSGSDVDAILHSCVHCGLCLPTCPTYRQTGVEMSSPRGRIYLMKALSEGRIGLSSAVFQDQMSECLNCRACEAVCPSGVRYGAALEHSRAQIEAGTTRRPLQHAIRALGFGLFRHLGLLRLLCLLLVVYQRSGLQWLLRRSGLLRLLGLAEAERLLPPMPARFVVPHGQRYPALGERRHTVALFCGCVMGTAFAPVHRATIRVLQRHGCDVLLPAGQGCCGALHIHAGDPSVARDLIQRNTAALAGLDVDAILVNAAGCGSTLKEAGAPFSSRVKDIHEFLAALPPSAEGLHELPMRVTYQEPCHLCHAQRISAAPRELLRRIPGLTLQEMADSSMCCGSAGIYNLTQPEMSRKLAARKVDNALATSPQVIATANPGCALQLRAELLRRGSAVPVRFIVELLDEAYR